MRTKTTNDDWKYGAAAAGGAVVATFLDEVLSVGPRVKRARNDGFDQGWWTRDAQLQPVMQNLQSQLTNLQNAILNQERAIGRIEGILATLYGLTQELLRMVTADKVNKEQMEDLVEAKIIETLKQISAQVQQAKLANPGAYQ